jgi:hypothetical protein
MKNEIEQIIVNHIDRKISLGEATTQILRLFAVTNTCDHHHQKWEGTPPKRICQLCGADRTRQSDW